MNEATYRGLPEDVRESVQGQVVIDPVVPDGKVRRPNGRLVSAEQFAKEARRKHAKMSRKSRQAQRRRQGKR